MPNKEIQLPTIIKDITLMSPGVWNEWTYPSEELKKAFELTDWNSHEVTSLFLDHPENSNNAAGSWAGRIINQKLLSDGTVKADLEVWDEATIINLTLAKAKFGVSPRVIGKENEETKTFTDFIFDNFSIVSKPAQSTAMIELSSKNLLEGLVVRQLNKEDYIINDTIRTAKMDEVRKKIISLAKEFGIEMSDLVYSTPSEKKKKKLKGGKKEMSDEEKNEEVKSEETSEENKAEESKGEESKGEESASGEENKELSDSDVLSIMNDNFEDFNLGGGEVIVLDELIDIVKKQYPNLKVEEIERHLADVKESYADTSKAYRKISWMPK
ncbi:hypothetical protein LCGC14_1573710, partial [marine sediment metagenome]